ncbi:WD40 repeat-like protein [Trametopsis cervina]|nr:WD40 repeat-like protein [Trametopsis cervina]
MSTLPDNPALQYVQIELSEVRCEGLLPPTLGICRRKVKQFRLDLFLDNSAESPHASATSPGSECSWAEPIVLRIPKLLDTSQTLTIKVRAKYWFRYKVIGEVTVDSKQLGISTAHQLSLTTHPRSQILADPAAQPVLCFSTVIRGQPTSSVTFNSAISDDRRGPDSATATDPQLLSEPANASDDRRGPDSATATDPQLLSEPANPSFEQTVDPRGEARAANIAALIDAVQNIFDNIRLQAERISPPVPVAQTVATAGAAADHAENTADGVLSTWTPILNNINVFVGIVGQIADVRNQIHPYAKAAWSVISAIPKIINTQLENDKSMAELVKAIDDMFVFLCDTKRLELHNVASHAKTIKLIVQQTTESGVLLYDYLKTRNFWVRTLKHSLSDVQSMFRQHVAVFERLRQEFINDAVLESEANTQTIQAMTSRIDIATVRTWELVDSTAAVLEKHVAKDYLDDMHYIYEAQCVSEKRCLPGTRESIISDITDWAFDYANGPEARAGIFLLTGVAGCGKSAIAHEIAHRFADMHRLGSSFCFDASRQAARSPNYLFSTISRGIAKLDARWKDALVAVLQEPYTEPKTMSQEKQIEDFLSKPSHKLHFVGPIVVVIDALDESGSRDSREGLIKNIVKMSKILPSNFRFLITTRAEEDIMATLPDEPNVTCVDLVSIDAASTSSDIRHLIEIELSSNPRTLGLLEKAYPDQTWLTRLVDSSQNLFQWATTACRFVKERKAGQSVSERMEILLEEKDGTESPLDSIYIKVFSSVCDVGTPGSKKRQRYQTALGLVLAVHEPLAMSALTELLAGNPEAVEAIDIYVPFLGSLFRGAGPDGVPIRPLHTSLLDFLADPRRSGDYHVEPYRENDSLAQASLRTIAAGPQFNICHIETSYDGYSSIPDLQQRIETHIPPALSYAHRFWDAHVRQCKNPDTVQSAIDHFFNNSVLVWVEVMLTLSMVNTIGIRVRQLREWNKQQKGMTPDSTFTDVERFISMCGNAITISTPHLYLSALAFVPQTSFIHERYTKRYSRALRVKNSGDIRWPQCLFWCYPGIPVADVAVSPDGQLIASAQGHGVQLLDAATSDRVGQPLLGHSGNVHAIAFSPDGKTIVSGSDDFSIRLWSTATGQPIGQHLLGYAGVVLSIAFSPDGTKIVSGSHDSRVILWNAVTQRPICILKGHSGTVMSVAFSPDSTKVVSGAEDQTIRLWELATRKQIGAALTGHQGEVCSVAFSPDGETVVSGSADGTIRFWDVVTHASIGEPLIGHSDVVNSVMFSPEGSRLISSSLDSSIRVWDITQRRQVGYVLTGQKGWVVSAVFPTDGQKVVSGSYDGTIGVWDIATDGSMSESVAALESVAWSLTFSPDGQQLASGLRDGTIRQLDPATGQAIGKPLIGHSHLVRSLVFSLDGRKLVSGSHDCTVRQWDIATGDMVGGPLVGHTAPIGSVVISPNGQWIVSGSYDRTILRWDAATGQRDGEFVIPGTSQVSSLAISPDGRIVLAGLDDSTLRLWNTAATEPIGDPLTGHTDEVWSVVFSPDGRMIASGSKDCTVRLWDTETMQMIGRPLTGHTMGIEPVMFSPDGMWIASGSHDQTVRKWSVATQESIGRPLVHTGLITCAAISPDGQQIIVGTGDGTRAWKASAGTDVASSHTDPASPSALLYTDSSFIVDGWVLGPDGALLFWIAPDYRSALCRPGNTWILSARALELDLSCFAHGTSWTDCRDSTTLT